MGRGQVVLIGAVVVIALALLWGASEMHYGNCIEKAKLATNSWGAASSAAAARASAADECSHLPF